MVGRGQHHHQRRCMNSSGIIASLHRSSRFFGSLVLLLCLLLLLLWRDDNNAFSLLLTQGFAPSTVPLRVHPSRVAQQVLQHPLQQQRSSSSRHFWSYLHSNIHSKRIDAAAAAASQTSSMRATAAHDRVRSHRDEDDRPSDPASNSHNADNKKLTAGEKPSKKGVVSLLEEVVHQTTGDDSYR
jgi:uncharacterized protein YdaU (DUF1376 family)